MPFSRRQTGWLLIAGLGLLLVAVLSPHIIPLYDGVGFPDEPYRYAGRTSSNTSPPTTAEREISAQSLKDYNQYVTSRETGPQISVTFDVNSIILPRSASEVEVSASPQAPTSQPAGGQIAGNVYVITAQSHPGPPKFNNANAAVALRLPQGTALKHPPTMVYRPGGGKWQPLKTDQVGADIYQAGFQGLGQYALENVADPAAVRNSSAPPSKLLITVILIGIVAAVIIAIRIMNQRKQKREENQR